MKFDILKIKRFFNEKLYEVYKIQSDMDRVKEYSDYMERYINAFSLIGPIYRGALLPGEKIFPAYTPIFDVEKSNVEKELHFYRLSAYENISAFPDNISDVEYTGYDFSIEGVSDKSAFRVLGSDNVWNKLVSSIMPDIDIRFRTGDYFDKWNTVVIKQLPVMVVKVNSVQIGDNTVDNIDPEFPYIFQFGENINTGLVKINTSLTEFDTDQYYIGFKYIDVLYREYIGYGYYRFKYRLQNDHPDTAIVNLFTYTPFGTRVYVTIRKDGDTSSWNWDSRLGGALDISDLSAGNVLVINVEFFSDNKYLTPLFYGLTITEES